LIGAVIALIITNFDKLLNVFPPLNAAFEVVRATLGAIVEGVKWFTDAIGLTEFATADALDKSIEDRDKAISDLDRQEKRAVLQARKNGQDVTKVEEEYANKRIAKYKEIIDNAEKLTREGAKLTEDQVKAVQDAKNALDDIDLKKMEKEAADAEKAREDARKAEEEAQRQREANAAKAEQKRQERARAAEAERQRIIEQQKAVTESLKQDAEARYQATLTDVDRELRVMDLKYQKLREQAAGNKEILAAISQAEAQEQSDILQRAAQKEIAIQRQAAEESRKIREEEQRELIALQEEASEELRQAKMTEEQKELDALQTRYFERKTILENQNADTLELTELFELQKKEIEDKYAQERKDKKDADDKELLEKEEELKAKRIQAASDAFAALQSLNEIAMTNTAARIADVDKQIASAQTAQQKKELQARRKQLEVEGKKAFERNKLLQIAQTLIQTYTSATAAYASQMSVPSPDAPIRAAVAAAAAVAAGLLNVNKIRKTQYESGGASDSSQAPTPAAVGGGNFATPIGPSGPNANLTNLQNRPPQPTQAYVLAGDVADAQNARTKVEDLARLTG